MKPAIFRCSTDRSVRSTTCIVMGLLVVIPIVLLAGGGGESEAIASAIVLVTLVTIAVIPIIIYGNQPRRIEVTSETIVLKCPFRTKIIPRDAKTEVRRVRDYDTQSLWRSWGADGIFGKYGLFASKLYPRMHFYAKRSNRDWILVKSAKRIYVLAPDDGEAFLKLFS